VNALPDETNGRGMDMETNVQQEVTLIAHESALEDLVDRYGLTAVLMMLASICTDKADHIRSSYSDATLANSWDGASVAVANTCTRSSVRRVSP
jgi:hypothetical protein